MNSLENIEYIIFTRSIVGIGGAEIYIRNKVKFLKECGISVTVISTKKGLIKIDDLKEWEENIIQECLYDPFLYTENQRYKILDIIKNKLGNISSTKQIVIESSFIQGSLWAELIAKFYNANNFSFLLDDIFPKLSDDTFEYFKFKLNRKELAGIHNKSLEWLFSNYLKLTENQKYYLSFTCINSIEDTKKAFNYRDGYDISIGTISRLNKDSLHYIIDNVIAFAKRNLEKKIYYVLFGGGNKKLEKDLYKKFSSISNVCFEITGEMFPIPYDWVNKFDLFINVAGAARATWYSAIPTMSLDINTGEALGILGVHTTSTQYKTENDTEVWNTIEEGLDDIFVKNKIDLSSIRNQLEKKVIKVDFSEHLVFINASIDSMDKEYFDFEYYKANSLFGFLIKSIYPLFGINGVNFIINKLKTLRKIIKGR